MKEKLLIKGEYIEVFVRKTSSGDFIGTANFIGNISMSICRSHNKKEAKEGCIKRLFDYKDIHKNNSI